MCNVLLKNVHLKNDQPQSSLVSPVIALYIFESYQTDDLEAKLKAQWEGSPTLLGQSYIFLFFFFFFKSLICFDKVDITRMPWIVLVYQ